MAQWPHLKVGQDRSTGSDFGAIWGQCLFRRVVGICLVAGGPPSHQGSHCRRQGVGPALARVTAAGSGVGGPNSGGARGSRGLGGDGYEWRKQGALKSLGSPAPWEPGGPRGWN